MSLAPSTRVSHLAAIALTAALFLFVFGANCDVLDRYGSDMPNMDQWDAEGVHLLIPWLHHDHFVRELFYPQNEHRVVLTKLQNWALAIGGRQWDARAQSLFNAALHAAIAIGLWLLARRLLRGAPRALAYIGIALIYGLPLSWQNLLAGFHSQQYWLILLSGAAIACLPFAIFGSTRWWCGLAALILALGSMGSGFLAAAAVLVLIVVREVGERLNARKRRVDRAADSTTPMPPIASWLGIRVTATIAVAVVAVGFLTRHEVDYHEALKAKSAHDFIFTVLRALEWPLVDHDCAGLLLWAPWLTVALLLGRSLVRRCQLTDEILILFGFGSWVLLQILATGYARGAGAEYPASRYMDTLMFGAVVNLVALGSLARAARSAAQRWTCWTVAAAWLGAFGLGAVTLVRHNATFEMPSVSSYFRAAEAHLRAYLASGDEAELVEPMPYLDVPRMVERVADPALRDLLPQSVRPAMAVTAAAGDHVFARNFASQRNLEHERQYGLPPEAQPLPSRPTWGSYTAGGLANTGTWTSAPLTPTLAGWLKFETAGNLGEPGVSLELHDATTDRRLMNVVPSKVSGLSWRSVYVPAPRQPFTIVARDEDTTRWLAFSAPVEMSEFSYRCWRVVKNGRLLAECAVILALLGALFSRATPTPAIVTTEREAAPAGTT